jgi:Ca2+-binding RTX toxin-like protein/LysM repeat protein
MNNNELNKNEDHFALEIFSAITSTIYGLSYSVMGEIKTALNGVDGVVDLSSKAFSKGLFSLLSASGELVEVAVANKSNDNERTIEQIVESVIGTSITIMATEIILLAGKGKIKPYEASVAGVAVATLVGFSNTEEDITKFTKVIKTNINDIFNDSEVTTLESIVEEQAEKFLNQSQYADYNKEIANFLAKEFINGKSFTESINALSEALTGKENSPYNEVLQKLSNSLTDNSIQFTKPGDTLSQIAKDHGLNLNELLALNPQYKTNPDFIKTGVLLILKDNTGTQSLSEYLKENANNSQAINSLIDTLKTELKTASVIRSPLTLDLDGDGIVETTSKQNSGVYFDHDNNGFAEQSGWVDKDDGLLVFDKNGNNKIDNGSELFGNNTVLSNGNTATNGFEALKALDTNQDGKVDKQDVGFNNLKVWQDKNSNGKLDDDELLSMGDTGIKSLNTNYTNSNEIDTNNNHHKQQGNFTKTDGTTNKMNDVWFDVDLAKTIETHQVAIDEAIANLPNFAGFGNVHSLHQAMALDTTGKLQGLVEQVISTSGIQQDALLTQMIYHWAGVEDININSRLSNDYSHSLKDSRKLEALEELMGDEFLGTWCWGTRDKNPHGKATPIIAKAFYDLQSYIKAKLFDDNNDNLLSQIRVSTNNEGKISEVHVATFVNYLSFEYADSPQNALNQLKQVKTALLELGEAGKQTLLALEQSGNENGNELLQMLARDIDQHLVGTNGNDVLTSGSGFDILEGGNGHDTINAGKGYDQVTGGNGNDNYIFNKGDGTLEIMDANGYDKLILGKDINKADIKITQEADGFVYLRFDSSADVIKFKQSTSTGGLAIDRIDFTEGGTISSTQILASIKTLTDNNDTLTGNRYGTNNIEALAGDDIITGGRYATNNINGGAGDDTITGGYYNDNLNGGLGHDKLNGNSGHDTINAGKGYDQVTGGSGNDNYIFNKGDGTLEIMDANGYDKLILGKDINKTDIKITQEADGFVYLRFDSSADVIKFKQSTSTGGLAIDRIDFTEGGTISSTQILASIKTLTDNNDTLTGNKYGTNNIKALAGNDIITGGRYATNNINGGAGNDTIKGGYYNDNLNGGLGHDKLNGNSGHDTINAGKGYDQVTGGSGNDNYIFNKGDGTLEIMDANGYDKLILGKDINKADIKITQEADGFVYLRFDSSADVIKFKQSTSTGGLAIDRIDFTEGGTISSTQILASIKTLTDNNDTLTGNRYGTNNIEALAGDDTITGGRYATNNINGGAGDDTITGGYYNDNLNGGLGHDKLNGNSGHDTINAGKGYDQVTGGNGNDNYIFNKGDGTLEIMDANGYDKLSFGKDITMQDIGLTQDSDNIYLEILSTGDKVQLKSGNNSNQIGVDIVYFDNGSNWSASHLMNASIIDDGQQVL